MTVSAWRLDCKVLFSIGENNFLPSLLLWVLTFILRLLPLCSGYAFVLASGGGELIFLPVVAMFWI